MVDVDVVGWWGRRLAADFVADLADGLLVGRRLAADFLADLADGLLVGRRLAADFVADLADGLLVVSNGFGNSPLIIRYIRYKIRC